MVLCADGVPGPGINRPDGSPTVSQGQGFWGQLGATNINRGKAPDVEGGDGGNDGAKFQVGPSTLTRAGALPTPRQS